MTRSIRPGVGSCVLCAFSSAVLAGCGSDSALGTGACITDTDCPAGLSCGYAVADGCVANGVCVQSNCQEGACFSPAGMCGCDGQTILPVLRQSSANSSTILYASAPSSGKAGPCAGITVPDAAAPDGSVLPDGGACHWPASASTFSDASGSGCTPRAGFGTCEVSNGGTGEPDGTIIPPDIANGTCTNACSPSQYALTCVGAALTSAIPAPDTSLNCRVIPIPTPSDVLVYCCPCAKNP